MRNRVRMVTACNYPVTDGIEILTDSPRGRRDRTLILEWLLSRCGHVPVLEEKGVTAEDLERLVSALKRLEHYWAEHIRYGF